MKEYNIDVPTRKGGACVCMYGLKGPEALGLLRLEGGSKSFNSNGHSRQSKLQVLEACSVEGR